MKSLDLIAIGVVEMNVSDTVMVDGGKNVPSETMEVYELCNHLIDGDFEGAWDQIKSWF
ncbi:MAG: hypothetical protein R6U46_01025 [Marinilabilia sp.]